MHVWSLSGPSSGSRVIQNIRQAIYYHLQYTDLWYDHQFMTTDANMYTIIGTSYRLECVNCSGCITVSWKVLSGTCCASAGC
jgi:hypothetical protein